MTELPVRVLRVVLCHDLMKISTTLSSRETKRLTIEDEQFCKQASGFTLREKGAAQGSLQTSLLFADDEHVVRDQSGPQPSVVRGLDAVCQPADHHSDVVGVELDVLRNRGVGIDPQPPVLDALVERLFTDIVRSI